MCFLENYYENVIQYDFINKYHYKNLQNLPRLQKIILNFGYKNPNLKNLTSSLLALELITAKRGTLTTAKNSHILLKIRKGSPIGCKVILKKSLMYQFFTKLLIDIFPQMKEFNGFYLHHKSLQKKTFSYQIKNPFSFLELERNSNFFNNLSNLNITFVTNTQSQNELLFLFNSFKLPINI